MDGQCTKSEAISGFTIPKEQGLNMATKKTQSPSQTSEVEESPVQTGDQKRAAILEARKRNLQRAKRQRIPRTLR